ncbi:MAG: DEAD/DEAH box helicase family protein [Acidimicrobiia bacterium]|nr:DEAD/DEAH box helicase family protein [Acidimicrobiia bacterium]
MGQFNHLEEFEEAKKTADQASLFALPDPRASCFYSRLTLELLIKWAFEHDRSLDRPYDDNLSALLHSRSFRQLAGDRIFKIAKEIIRYGNKAVHDAGAPSRHDSVACVAALFSFSHWFARTYARTHRPSTELRFDPNELPNPANRALKSRQQLEELEQELEAQRLETELVRKRLHGAEKLEEETAALRAQIDELRKQRAGEPANFDLKEDDTREYLIDLLLQESGWLIGTTAITEHPVSGMPNTSGTGRVDYALMGQDGRPLAILEAKRASKDPGSGRQQALLYADQIEAATGQRPIIFYSNGYEHWIWDDARYPPRQIQGFLTRTELELAINRRTTRKSLLSTPVKPSIADRYYQQRAIRSITESFENDNERKALLVMATGTGKTRTVVALTDLMMDTRWAHRILFLADRRALVKQAVRAFKEHIPDSPPVNLLEDRHGQGDIYVATYPTMSGLIDELQPDGTRRFGPGFFDLVIIDEAHRSVYNRYRHIFEWFDSLLVGLTATPKDEIDRNTYSLFDLVTGSPTDVYELESGVADGFLVPPRAISAPLRFPNMGITYDELTDAEKEEWSALDWSPDADDDPDVPQRVDPKALNDWLFNANTVDESLKMLMRDGQHVEGGELLGKTIIFAKSRKHANFIVTRFDQLYPHLKGSFARVITADLDYAEDLLEDFEDAGSELRIAVSVDMLDTGVDIPEVVNLVFFKPVRSKAKFWQMIGRGTRLRPGLFGPSPDGDKHSFTVIDHCMNLEYFSQSMLPAEGPVGPTLDAQIFEARMDIVAHLDEAGDRSELRPRIVNDLSERIADMNLESYQVRSHRALVEKYREAESWDEISLEDRGALIRDVAPLPVMTRGDSQDVRRFDLLMFKLELAVLQNHPARDRLRRRLVSLVERFEKAQSESHAELMEEILGDSWWDGLSADSVEHARRELRAYAEYVQAEERDILYTNFQDDFMDLSEVDLADLSDAAAFSEFRKKANAYLREHLNEGVVAKLRKAEPIDENDILELQSIFVAAGIGSPADFEFATERAGSFGRFIRSQVGLETAAVQSAFSEFLDNKAYSSAQIRFIELVISQLATAGSIAAGDLYTAPFTLLAPQGPESLFNEGQIDSVLAIVDGIEQRASGGSRK